MAPTPRTRKATHIQVHVLNGNLRLPKVEGTDYRASARAYAKLLSSRLARQGCRLTARITEASDYINLPYVVMVEGGTPEGALAAIQREEDRLWASPQEWQVPG